MAHRYYHLQHWNQWLLEPDLGQALLRAECEQLSKLLANHYGKHALLIGNSHQQSLFDSTNISCHALLSPLAHHSTKQGYIEGDLHELPILTGSMDLVIIPHTLEFIENPRQLLSEACRVIRPEGLIAVLGFNPISLWGLIKKCQGNDLPWAGHTLYPRQIKKWLQLLDFKLEQQTYFLHRPPLAGMYEKLAFLEKAGQRCLPSFGSVYLLLARAKVFPLTPIKMKWKQKLTGIYIPSSISGHA